MSNDKLIEWLNVMVETCNENIRQGIMVEYWRGQQEAYKFTIDKIVLNQTQEV
jgi:hypothetical protein